MIYSGILITYLSNLYLIYSILNYLFNGIYAVYIKFQCLVQFSQMLCSNNSHYRWQSTTREIPSLDYLDTLSITNYGKLRKILLDFGKRYESRIQIIFGTIGMMIVLELIIIIANYFFNNGDFNITIFIHKSPFLIALLIILLYTAKLNGFF